MAVFFCHLAIALMTEAARSSETSVNFYQTTRRYNPEDSHLRTHRRENLKSYEISLVYNVLKFVFSKRSLLKVLRKFTENVQF
jgi:hypothetical protein